MSWSFKRTCYSGLSSIGIRIFASEKPAVTRRLTLRLALRREDLNGRPEMNRYAF